jgi:hypothetical protein
MSARTGNLQKRFGNIENFIDVKIAKCSYSKALARWIEVFGEQKVQVFFYDHLEENPLQYFNDVCRYLEISPDQVPENALRERINTGSGDDAVPETIIDKVRSAWREDIQQLSDMVPEVPRSWLE